MVTYFYFIKNILNLFSYLSTFYVISFFYIITGMISMWFSYMYFFLLYFFCLVIRNMIGCLCLLVSAFPPLFFTCSFPITRR